MKILFVCDTDPERIASGADVRTKTLIEVLRSLGDVRVVTLDTSARDVPGSCAVVRCEPMGIFRSLVNRVCRTFYVRIVPNCPPVMPFPRVASFEKAFPGFHFDLIVTRYLQVVSKIRLWRYGRVIVDIDDCPVQRYETIYAGRHCRLRRKLTVWFIRRQLHWLLRHCAGGWVSNPDDLPKFKSEFNVRALVNIPLPVPPGYDAAVPRKEMLMTVGDLTYAISPNVVGIENFLSSVWPRVREARPNLEYWIAGGGLSDEIRDRWSRVPGVRCLGFVEDLDGLYAQALATVVPIGTGGGSCVKTRESLVHGRCCLSTEFGARGLAAEDLRDGKCGVLIWRNAEDLVSSLKQLENADRRQELERAARDYADRALTQDCFIRQVRALIEGEGKRCYER